ncbi:MAG: hypothetical protein SGI92_05750 [Bryobacteraceae bacterium]|nr:hypothetical protein [Bryobacteraceae bacterium]
MPRIRVLVVSLLLSAALAAADAQQYGISTYAGGAPAPPMAAVSMAADPSGNLYFVDGYGFTSNPARSNSVFKIDSSGFITRFAGNSRTGFYGDGTRPPVPRSPSLAPSLREISASGESPWTGLSPRSRGEAARFLATADRRRRDN